MGERGLFWAVNFGRVLVALDAAAGRTGEGISEGYIMIGPGGKFLGAGEIVEDPAGEGSGRLGVLDMVTLATCPMGSTVDLTDRLGALGTGDQGQVMVPDNRKSGVLDVQVAGVGQSGQSGTFCPAGEAR